MSELLSQRAFAKHIGRSHVWVSKLVKQGKIPLVDGKIPLNEGMKAYKASKQLGYEANREANAKKRKQNKKPDTKKKTDKKEAAKESGDQAFTIPDDDMLPSSGSVSVDKVANAFNKARLAEKTYQAKLKELDYKEKQGLLIPREAVEADAAQTAEELRGMLFSIAPRISPICEGKEARDIEGIIEDAINEALTALNKSRFKK